MPGARCGEAVRAGLNRELCFPTRNGRIAGAMEIGKAAAFDPAQGKLATALQEIPHTYLVRILTNRLRAVKRFLRQGVRNRSGRRERSFQRQAGQIEELVEAVGNGFAVGAAAVVVEEDDGGIFCALVGGGDPIPGAAAGGGEAKAGA